MHQAVALTQGLIELALTRSRQEEPIPTEELAPLFLTIAIRYIGMPECDVHLTEAVVYLALAPKSNAIYRARRKVAEDMYSTMSYVRQKSLPSAESGSSSSIVCSVCRLKLCKKLMTWRS